LRSQEEGAQFPAYGLIENAQGRVIDGNVAHCRA
jgi:hypothetical protein